MVHVGTHSRTVPGIAATDPDPELAWFMMKHHFQASAAPDLA
jgi:hypothetical protein